MPRPKDLVKGWLIPVTFGCGLLSVGEVSGTALLRAVVVWIAVELLIYPARYQWNDIRGFAADQRHPAARERGRLPARSADGRGSLAASWLVIAARLTLTGLLVVMFPALQLAGILAFAAVGVLAVAVAYETLRSTATGRSGAPAAPVSPGVALLWVTVGAGYAVRGLTGLALAVDLPARPALAVAAAITLWAFGIAFVTSRWAVEVTAFATVRDGRLSWRARADHAREHLLALVRWLPPHPSPDGDLRDWAPLQRPTAPSAPWNAATLVAGAAAAVTGRLLCGPCPPAEAIAAVAVGVVTTALLVAGGRRRTGWLAAGVAALLAVLWLGGAPRPLLGVVPWLLLAGAYLYFVGCTPRRLAR
ncbi:hypothetical protein LV457_02215 [Mycobacterium sp. MYCO198283]|uniref:hypothetical protein n=1 Tax=Mycobacterium sp. MYCO198283 TaxID=2883505 RepID=UPI001E2C52C8|nr:hypothetical protein [Mycobacterium sp. MYCO198283]MCG5431107.1 hypothetical protein [Mycobacterium sp. MYCO198283]